MKSLHLLAHVLSSKFPMEKPLAYCTACVHCYTRTVGGMCTVTVIMMSDTVQLCVHGRVL